MPWRCVRIFFLVLWALPYNPEGHVWFKSKGIRLALEIATVI